MNICNYPFDGGYIVPSHHQEGKKITSNMDVPQEIALLSTLNVDS